MLKLYLGGKDVVMDPSITYFPVGNGDTTLIALSDGYQIHHYGDEVLTAYEVQPTLNNDHNNFLMQRVR